MSNAIRFLENLGTLPRAGRSWTATYASDVASLPIEQDQKQALLGLDADALNALLGGRAKMMMQVWAPMEETPDGDEQKDEDVDGDGDGDPSDESVDK